LAALDGKLDALARSLDALAARPPPRCDGAAGAATKEPGKEAPTPATPRATGAATTGAASTGAAPTPDAPATKKPAPAAP
jgi:hypothetical protein